MNESGRGTRGALSRVMAAMLFASSLLLGGCANFYVDGGTKEVPASQFKRPASPQPVQMLFEFQTKGALNTRATAVLKAQVVELVTASGLFSQVVEAPVANGALMSVTLNNVPITDDAFAKGFVTGLTFGLAGQYVSDGYVCTVNYIDGAQGKPLVRTARHAIHTAMGTATPPAGSVKMESIDQAVRTMTKQVVSTTLNDISQAIQ